MEASDALRAIECYAGLRSVQLNEIRRQDPDRPRKAEERERIEIYREAVNAASTGDLVASLGHLERLGAVKECGISEQRERLVEAYLGFAARAETAFVVSQTRAEVREINEAVRAGLRRCGALRGADTTVTALERIDLTAAQKADPGHYPAMRSPRMGQRAGNVRCHDLCELLQALQDFAVKWVRAVPKRYQPLDNAETCKVTKISLTAAD